MLKNALTTLAHLFSALKNWLNSATRDENESNDYITNTLKEPEFFLNHFIVHMNSEVSPFFYFSSFFFNFTQFFLFDFFVA
jgi:hypothetical protein